MTPLNDDFFFDDDDDLDEMPISYRPSFMTALIFLLLIAALVATLITPIFRSSSRHRPTPTPTPSILLEAQADNVFKGWQPG